MNNHLFEYLDWDTNFFKFKVGAIRNTSNTQTICNILKEKKAEDYSLIYIFSKNKIDLSNYHYDNKLVDKKITYLKKLNANISDIDPNISTYEDAYPDKELIQLAIESGIYSRFKKDSKIEDEKFKEFYKLWIINSVNKKIAKDVLVYKETETIAGMITLGMKNNRGDIGIIAVDNNYRGKKIGTKLISAAESYFIKNNTKELQVVTQGDNIPACKLYEKNGFVIDKIEYVYHAWLT